MQVIYRALIRGKTRGLALIVWLAIFISPSLFWYKRQECIVCTVPVFSWSILLFHLVIGVLS
jgi:hypothetical protein